MTFPRTLRMDLPEGQSAFLWGPRQTGKTTYLRASFPESILFDLLRADLMLELARRPSLLRERLEAAPPERLRHPVIIDEVQKVPHLLDEVYWLDLDPGRCPVARLPVSKERSAASKERPTPLRSGAHGGTGRGRAGSSS